MTKLYIANAKVQTEEFTYRVPDGPAVPGQTRSGPRVQQIPTGKQVEISGDLSTAQVDAIIDQHRPYGLIGVDEVDRTRAYSGLVYSIDKPVSPARIQQLMGNNLDVLEERGRESRELAAVQTSNEIEETMQTERMPGALKNLEMEVVEQRDQRSNGPEMIPERTRVTRDENAPPRSSSKAKPKPKTTGRGGRPAQRKAG